MTVSAKGELNYVASSLAPNTWHPLMAISQIAMMVMGWLSVTLEVFVRRDFGERYLSWLRLFLGYLIMDMITLIPRIIFSMIPFMSGPTIATSSLFMKAFFIMGAYHQWRIWQRNRQGIAWHSASFGVSRFTALPVSDWVLYRFVEPGICLVAGFIIKTVDPVMGIWVIAASISLFIKNQMVFNDQRARLLDIIDARIESAAMKGALEGKPKQETAGFSVMAVPEMNLIDESIPDIAATVTATMNSAQPEVIALDTATLIPAPENTPSIPQQDFQSLAFIVGAVTSDKIMSDDTVT